MRIEWIDRGLAICWAETEAEWDKSPDAFGGLMLADYDTGYACGDYEPHYPVPAIYSGPSNPAWHVISWLSWEQAKQYVNLRNKY